MLVCSVVLRPKRGTIAAAITESATALDALSSGAIFATLADNPGTASEYLDAFVGQRMVEAASATASQSATIVAANTSAVSEAAGAGTVQDATITTAVATVTWDPATVTAVTLSGGNLVATNTGTTSSDQGARVASANGKTTGKYYYEITLTNIGGSSTGNLGVAIGTTASTYIGMGGSAPTGANCFVVGGNIYVSGSNVGGLGVRANGNVIGFAIDLDNRKIWLRVAPSGNWNNIAIASSNPASNVGGFTLPAGTLIPLCTFGGSGGIANCVFTANFGASAFSGAVPSGFTSGWPV